ncbi:MAG: hypothetical protein Q4D30_03520 [Bacteroidales bacterium]|nr:hypothetical protein [Bacteroidales bacterium]
MKKLFFAAVLTVATAMGGYHYYNATVTEILSDIAKANIEALADLHPSAICYQEYVEDTYTPIALQIVPCDDCKKTIWVTSCSSRSTCYN